MPLTKKGEDILASMTRTYGAKKAKSVFYASINKGKIKGAEKSRRPKSNAQHRHEATVRELSK